MARQLSFVLSEIVRVAEFVGINPRDMRRDVLLAHSEVTQNDLKFYGGLTRLRIDAAHEHSVLPDESGPQARGVALRNQYVGSLERKANSTEYLCDRLENMLANAFERAPVHVTKRPPAIIDKPSMGKRELVSLISDTHYGLSVDELEVPSNGFGWTTAARRTAKLVQQLVTWKPEHRDETTLTLVLAGDLIQGAIHVISEGRLVLLTEQIHGATSILVQAIDALRPHFARIRVVGVAGNHDRHVHRGGRATNAKWDSLAAMIFMGLKYAFRDAPEVTFSFPRTPYVTFLLPGGHLAFAAHGDTNMPTGNLGKSINVESIVRRVYALDASHVLPKPVSVVMLGHVHVPCYTVLANGCSLVVNGTLSGTEAYAQSLDIHGNNPTQVIYEATAEHPVGDFRVVRLIDADTDADLDAIIEPPRLMAAA